MSTNQDSFVDEKSPESTSGAPKDPAQNGTTPAAGQQKLHKPPVLLFFLPLVLIIAYAYFTR